MIAVWAPAAAAALLAGVLLLRRRFLLVTVTGLSMAPTLHHGESVLVRRAPLRALRRGQVVMLLSPGGTAAQVIKRVAALPGDPAPPAVADPRAAVHVPAGHLVVLGDNPSVSLDSRQFGFVPGDRVIGVVTRRLRTGGAVPTETPAAPVRRDRPRHPPRTGQRPAPGPAAKEEP